MDRLFKEYRGRIKLIYYHVTFSDKSFEAAEAALCAGAQNKYWEYHDMLFDRQSRWSDAATPASYFEEYAEDLGLNLRKFKSCMSNGSMVEVLDRDKKAALSRNVRSTPTIFIGDKRIIGAQPLYLYKSVIDRMLQEQ